MYIFKSHYKAYSTFVLDGDKRVPVKFSNGELKVYDDKLAKLIIDQKLGKDPYITIVGHLPKGEKKDGGKERLSEKRGAGKTETKKKSDDTPAPKRKLIPKSQKNKGKK